MSEYEIAVAAMIKICYNFWPILVLMAGALAWESINNNG